MEGFYFTLVLVAIVSILYILLKFQLSRGVEEKFNQSYKSRIQADVQEFYREMESYAALMENRILQFKKLVEREENVLKYQDLLEQIKKNKKGKQISAYVERSIAKEQQLLEAIHALKEDSAQIMQQFSKTKKEKIAHREPSPAAEIHQARVERNHPLPKEVSQSEAKSTSAEKNSIVDVLGVIGKKVTPILTGEKPSPVIETKVTERRPEPRITRSFNDQLLENMHILPPIEDNDQGQVTRPGLTERKKLSRNELEQAIIDLNDSSKRPAALGLLLSQGLTVEEISDFSGLPYSDLSATKSIYSL